MFKRWKDKRKDGESPVKNSSTADSQSPDMEASGFICPLCMIAFSSPDELQIHFVSTHDDTPSTPGANGVSSPTPSDTSSNTDSSKMWDERHGSLLSFDDEIKERRADSEMSLISTMKELEEKTAEVLSLQQELNDVNANLKEEKWYTTALKEEVDKLENEKTAKSEACQKLEEENVRMRNDYEEKIKLQESLKESAITECAQMKQELVRVIEAQCGSQAQHDNLAHRTSELASESTGFKMKFETEQNQRVKLEEEVTQLREQLGTKNKLVENLENQLSQRPKGDEVVSLKQNIVSLEQQLESLKQTRQTEQKHWQEKFETASNTVTSLESKMKEMEIEKSSRLQQFESLQTALSAGTDSRKQVQEQIQEKQQLIISLQHELNQAGVVLKEKESFVSFLQKQLDEAKSNLQTEMESKEEAKQIVRNLQTQLEEERRTSATRDNQMNELEEAIRQRKDDIARLQEERTNLISKIESGEGVQTAIQQLEQEKLQLEERLLLVEGQTQQHAKEASEKIEIMFKQQNEVNEDLAKATDKSSKLEMTLKEVTEKFNSSEQQLTQLRDEFKVKSDSLVAVEAAKVAEKSVLDEQIRSTQENLQEKTAELSTLQHQHVKLKDDLEASRGKCSELNSKLNSLEMELNNKVQKCEELEKELNKKCEAYLTLEQNSSALIAEKDKEIVEEKNVILQRTTEKNTLRDEIEKLKISYAENEKGWNMERSQLVSSLESTKNNLNTKDNRLTELEANFNASKQETSLMKDSLEKTNKSLQDELESTKNELTEAQQSHISSTQEQDSKMADLMNSLNSLREKLDNTQQMYDAKVQIQKELETQITHLEKEQIETQETIKELAEAHQEKLTNLEAQFGEMESRYKEQIKGNEDIINQMASQLESKDENLVELQRDKERLAEELAKPCEGCKNYEIQLCREQGIYKAEVEKVKGLENELTVAREDFKHLNKQIDASEEELAHVKQNAHDTEALLEQTVTQLNEVKTALSEKVKELDQQLKGMYTQQEQLNTEKESLELSLTAQKDAYEELLKSKNTIEAHIEEQKSLHEKFKEEATEKEQMVISQKLQLQAELTESQEQMKMMEETQEESQEATKRVQMLLKDEAVSLQTKLESEVKQKQEMEARLTLQITSLTENLSSARAEVGKVNGKCQELEEKAREFEKDTDNLRGEMMVLEATIHNNQDERRALLERLVNSEEDTDKLRQEVGSLQKKLDEAQAAMVELGQENQALQIQNNQKNSRRWEKDEQVTNCNNCNKPFSISIRKHHCRSCGLIFCNDCTGKTTVLPASKKPARVCDSCHSETANPVRGQ